MHDLMKAAAVRLACAALTSPSNTVVTQASVAIQASDPEVMNQLEDLQMGISQAVHGARNPSEALLVVLLMRMNQLVDSTTISSLDGAGHGQEGLQALGDSTVVELLKHVRWENLHDVEINVLFSQAASYKSTPASDYMKNALMKQMCQRVLGVGSGSVMVLHALPPGQLAFQYLAAWVDIDDIIATRPASTNWEAIAVKGSAGPVKSGSIDIHILVGYKVSPPGEAALKSLLI
jgi:hypothetical protein